MYTNKAITENKIVNNILLTKANYNSLVFMLFYNKL